MSCNLDKRCGCGLSRSTVTGSVSGLACVKPVRRARLGPRRLSAPRHRRGPSVRAAQAGQLHPGSPEERLRSPGADRTVVPVVRAVAESNSATPVAATANHVRHVVARQRSPRSGVPCEAARLANTMPSSMTMRRTTNRLQRRPKSWLPASIRAGASAESLAPAARHAVSAPTLLRADHVDRSWVARSALPHNPKISPAYNLLTRGALPHILRIMMCHGTTVEAGPIHIIADPNAYHRRPLLSCQLRT